MTVLKKHATIEHLRHAGLVAIFHHPDEATSLKIAEALIRGGVTVLEYTNRGDGAAATFSTLRSALRREHPDVLVGIGSTVDAGTAATAMNNGADFVISPALIEEVARTCHRRQVLHVPGCGTVTEMLRAAEIGCDVVKAFPADALGGPAFIKAVTAPCPWLQVLPTGGIGTAADDLRRWFDAGAFAVGLGSNLVPTSAVDNDDWDTITNRAAAAVGAIHSAR